MNLSNPSRLDQCSAGLADEPAMNSSTCSWALASQQSVPPLNRSRHLQSPTWLRHFGIRSPAFPPFARTHAARSFAGLVKLHVKQEPVVFFGATLHQLSYWILVQTRPEHPDMATVSAGCSRCLMLPQLRCWLLDMLTHLRFSAYIAMNARLSPWYTKSAAVCSLSTRRTKLLELVPSLQPQVCYLNMCCMPPNHSL